jgi:hypothetical protein
MIAGFEDGLLDIAAGKSVSLDLTFPQEYHLASICSTFNLEKSSTLMSGKTSNVTVYEKVSLSCESILVIAINQLNATLKQVIKSPLILKVCLMAKSLKAVLPVILK